MCSWRICWQCFSIVPTELNNPRCNRSPALKYWATIEYPWRGYQRGEYMIWWFSVLLLCNPDWFRGNQSGLSMKVQVKTFLPYRPKNYFLTWKGTPLSAMAEVRRSQGIFPCGLAPFHLISWTSNLYIGQAIYSRLISAYEIFWTFYPTWILKSKSALIASAKLLCNFLFIKTYPYIWMGAPNHPKGLYRAIAPMETAPGPTAKGREARNIISIIMFAPCIRHLL